MLEFDAFRLEETNLVFWLGLGAGKKGPLQVAEAGNLGGGMSSCLGGCGGYSAFRSANA